MRVDLDSVFNGELPEADWLVPNFMCRGSMTVLVGDAGAGKTYLSYYLSMCLACGIPFLGRKLTKSRILYFDEENSNPDACKYLSRVWIGLGRPDKAAIIANLRVEHMSLQASAGSPFGHMDMVAAEHDPDLIVVDTAMSGLAIADENDNSEAGRIVSSLRGIQARGTRERSLLILRHSLTGTKEGRGAKSWKGLCDSMLYFSARRGPKGKGGLRKTVIEPRKVRAYGLRNDLEITPSWVEKTDGISLSGNDVVK